MIQPTEIKERSDGWRLFWKTVLYTVAAVMLVALGFFGAMAVTGAFA